MELQGSHFFIKTRSYMGVPPSGALQLCWSLPRFIVIQASSRLTLEVVLRTPSLSGDSFFKQMSVRFLLIFYITVFLSLKLSPQPKTLRIVFPHPLPSYCCFPISVWNLRYVIRRAQKIDFLSFPPGIPPISTAFLQCSHNSSHVPFPRHRNS